MSDQFVSLAGIVPTPTLDEQAETMALLERMQAANSPAAWKRAAEIAEAHGCTVERSTTKRGRPGLGAVVRNAAGELVHGKGYRAVPQTIAEHFGEAL
ncbi:hypothetical protein [Methylobacterium soli]|uniref:Uncharacterized protein n=1 Tax=Methylobacterium soli TaxID=553447 RepID=A0A6L3SWW2_9HYPH|nr:hypothetical protein [Methylobacterium soli]KAB1078398.1 hypothetical protein F6X53_15040 [Methylobacterium soli]GJE46910.1 hypothetical protein AEGHOMDF_6119 [Methylobacterium soli]